jgi:hypothetical protein
MSIMTTLILNNFSLSRCTVTNLSAFSDTEIVPNKGRYTEHNSCTKCATQMQVFAAVSGCPQTEFVRICSRQGAG